MPEGSLVRPSLEGSLVRSTLAALMKPRRLVPILLVAGPLVLMQDRLSRDPWAAPLGVLMCVAFVVFAPLSWRVLFPEGLDLAHGAIRLVLYAAVGAGIVLTIGAVIPKFAGMATTLLTTRSSLVVCGALFLVGGWGLARDIGLEESLERERARSEQAELLALRSHLDPHFLFNTLNAIAEWCRENGEVAERAVLQLSAMLRTVLEGVKSEAWPLAREIELAKTLFSLHLLRDPELFTLSVDVPELLPLDVPPLLLLPLAENAVKHGPAAGHRGEIALRVRTEEGHLVVTLTNPGPYRGPRSGSDGVPTVVKRLRLAYGPAASLRFREETGRTAVDVRLPLRAGR